MGAFAIRWDLRRSSLGAQEKMLSCAEARPAAGARPAHMRAGSELKPSAVASVEAIGACYKEPNASSDRRVLRRSARSAPAGQWTVCISRLNELSAWSMIELASMGSSPDLR